MRKKIAVISEDLAEPWDEGIKKFSYSISRALEAEYDVLMVNVDRSGVESGAAVHVPGTRTFISRVLRSKLRAFSPDAVIYVPSSSQTVASFLRARVIRSHVPRVPLGMVALIPRRHRYYWKFFLKSTAPDIVFVPSFASLLALERFSVRAELIPVGFDKRSFRPPLGDEKDLLRKKYGVDVDAFVFLHVGHLSPKRSLEKLATLLEVPLSEVLVVASTSTPQDSDLRGSLEAAGVRVVREAVKIEEFYRLSDCYVFPVEDSEGCVEMPLSIVEALASGLPVLATPFGGIRDFFPEGSDLVYWSSLKELREASLALRHSRPPVRSMESFSWEMIAARLMAPLIR